MWVLQLFCVASEIEGTLELSELYSLVKTEDQPEPVVVDESPNGEDVRFMRKALDVSMNSKDTSTKVRAYYNMYYLSKKTPWLECSMLWFSMILWRSAWYMNAWQLCVCETSKVPYLLPMVHGVGRSVSRIGSPLPSRLNPVASLR